MVSALQYLFWAAVFSTAVGLPGLLLAEAFLRGRPAGPEKPLAAIALGVASWTAVTFALCTLGVFTRPVVLGIACAFAAAYLLLRIWRIGGGLPRPTIIIPKFTVEGSLLAGVITVALPVLFLLCLQPVIAADEGSYHLTVPKLYLEHHGFRPIPFNVYSNWPLNVELLFALAMQVKDHVLARLVHWLFLLLTLFSLYRFGRSRGGEYAGLLAAALFLANPVVLLESCLAYVDIAYAWFFLIGTWFILEAAESKADEHLHLILAGVAAGMLAGIKLTGWFAVLALTALYFLTAGRQVPFAAARTPSAGARFVRYFGLPCIALSLPWFIKCWYYTGNPVYPFLHSWFGGPYWSAALGEQLRNWHFSTGMGRGLMDYLLLPVRVILSGGQGYDRFDGTLNPVWIVLLPLAILAARRNPLVRRLLFTSLVYFLCWAASSQQMRFLIPILPLVALAAAATATGWLSNVRTPGRRTVAATALSAGLIGSLIACSVEGIRNSMTLAEMSKTGLLPRQGVVDADVFDFVNVHLPPDARILFLNTNNGFPCDREYVADSFFEASQTADLLRSTSPAAAVRETLLDHGLTHVLWCSADWGIPFPPALFAFLDAPACAAVVYQSADGSSRLYAIRRWDTDPTK